MANPATQQLNLLGYDEQRLRFDNVRRAMDAAAIPALLLADYADIYYLTGRVFAGYIYIGPRPGDIIYFVKRPVHLVGDGVVPIRKPEQMAQSMGISLPERIGLELDIITASAAQRLSAALPGVEIVNASALMRSVRSVKTPLQQALMRRSGVLHAEVYDKIPSLYQPGMTDIALQIEIERLLRLSGCLGQFRISGDSMEIFMGSLIAGDNADAPSPYDFAMGGAGIDPSLPVGADGTLLRPGMSVLIDMCGNFTGYMTDMSRTFSVGPVEHLGDMALKAHQTSIEICRALERIGTPGTEAKAMYDTAAAIAADAGLEQYFMGHRQHAGFVGHGVGIEINELPVIAPRSRDILATGNTLALEPKFVIPRVGAVGIENTYIVTPDGLECITNAPEQIIPLLP